MTRARVLLTTAGRKSYLASIFKASRACGFVLAVDADPLSPIRLHADHFAVVPRLEDEAGFVDAVHALSLEWGVDCVLPQNDRELGALAAARGRFEKDGVRIAGVGPEQVRVVGDKLRFAEWVRSQGLAHPETALAHPRAFPVGGLVEKDRFGQGSAGLVLHTVPPRAPLAKDKVVQPRLAGDEYNLDVLRDVAGEVVGVSVKRKLLMQGGSTDRAVSAHSPALVRLGEQLADELGVFGSIDVDVMLGDGEPQVLDVNPRLGGGFPFTATYCPAYVDALLEVATGRPVGRRPLTYDAGVLVCREATYTAFPVPAPVATASGRQEI
jgi:carbamoyl-phosphate synthase large subunit